MRTSCVASAAHAGRARAPALRCPAPEAERWQPRGRHFSRGRNFILVENENIHLEPPPGKFREIFSLQPARHCRPSHRSSPTSARRWPMTSSPLARISTAMCRQQRVTTYTARVSKDTPAQGLRLRRVATEPRPTMSIDQRCVRHANSRRRSCRPSERYAFPALSKWVISTIIEKARK